MFLSNVVACSVYAHTELTILRFTCLMLLVNWQICDAYFYFKKSYADKLYNNLFLLTGQNKIMKMCLPGQPYTKHKRAIQQFSKATLL